MLNLGACNETHVLGDCHPTRHLETAYYRHDSSRTLQFVTHGVVRASRYFILQPCHLLVYLDTLDLTVTIASQLSLEKRREWPCFPTALIFSKRNLHVCTFAVTRRAQPDINEK